MTSCVYRTVADQLKVGVAVSAQLYSDVAVLFSAIADFTSLTSVSTPLQIVTLLNDLYVTLDDVVSAFNVYKVTAYWLTCSHVTDL